MHMRLFSLSIAAALSLSSCGPKEAAIETKATGLPPIHKALSCLRGTGPIIAAHRGRDKFTKSPENALSSLKRLKKSGFVMAEIDIARLKDGVHILHHDGVWEDTTTGTGIVASTTWEQAETFLLKRRKGGPVSERLMTLSSALNWADQDFYLELDIKSSANSSAIIESVRAAGMEDHVILIAYSNKQASQLSRLAKQITGKDIMVSSPGRSTALRWMGTKAYDPSQTKKSGTFTSYGMMSPKYAKRADYTALSILVTDYPPEAKLKAKTRGKDRARIEGCRH